MPFVDATGLQIKTIEEIVAELSAQQKAEISATLNTEAEEPIGQMNGIMAAQLRELWEVAQVAYNGFNPDAAEGLLLEKTSAITGTVRAPATKTTVPLDADLDAATTLIAGTHFANVAGNSASRFTPAADYTAGSGGVQSVPFVAEFAGATVANSGTITEIATALAGWNSITNPLDAVVGTDVDTDPELRTRREDELRATGSTTVDAIRADILLDDEVEQVSVFENTSLTTDGTGLPGKAIEAVVFDGDPSALTNDQIAQLVFDTKGAGILAFGLETGNALDSTGTAHAVGFSRPATVDIWLEVDLDIDSVAGYSGAAAVEAALVLLNASDLSLGRDLILQRVASVCIGFEGVIDVTAIRAGLASSPVGTVNIPITTRELGRLDTARIIIAENIVPIP